MLVVDSFFDKAITFLSSNGTSLTNPLVPDVPSAAGLFKYVWLFSGNQALQG